MAAAYMGNIAWEPPRLQQPAATGRPGETEPAGQRPAPTLLPCSLSTALGSRGTRIGLAHAETTYRLVRDFSRLDAMAGPLPTVCSSASPCCSRSLSLSTQLQYETNDFAMTRAYREA